MTETTTYRVRDFLLADLTSKFSRLAKRAEKLGVPAPSFTVVATEEVPEYVESPAGGSVPTGRLLTWHTVQVEGEAPKFAGWSMLAVIDRDLEETDSPNVVHLLPGVELDVAWRTLGDVCDHCVPRNIARGRKLLVVVQHDNGERKVVGTTCLHDFLGHTSPQAIASWVATLSTLDDYFGSLDNDDEREHGRRIEDRFDPESFLAEVARSIESYGWTSRGAASETRTATVDRVVEDIRDRRITRTNRYGTVIPPEPTPTEAHAALATDALVWANEMNPGSNDYLLNAQAVAMKSGWRARDLGLGGSIISAYQRELGYQAERAAQAIEQTAPCPDGKATITGTIVGIKVQEGYRYGTTETKLTVLDDRGFKVFGSRPAALESHSDIGPCEDVLGYHVETVKVSGTPQSPRYDNEADAQAHADERNEATGTTDYFVVTSYRDDRVHVAAVEVGDRVRFNCTVQRKDDTFGFYKRPTRASVVEMAL